MSSLFDRADLKYKHQTQPSHTFFSSSFQVFVVENLLLNVMSVSPIGNSVTYLLIAHCCCEDVLMQKKN